MEKEFIDFKAKGSFFAEIRKNGKLIETIEKHNLIVNTSCKIIAKLLAGARVALPVFDNQIVKLGVGSFADASTPFTNYTSSPDKTELDGDSPAFYKYFIKIENNECVPNTDGGIPGVNYCDIIYDESNNPNDVIYQFYIGTSECNRTGGNNIWEFGLFSDDSTMFSMLTRLDMGKNYPIVKDETVDISGYWKIQIRNTSV
ncbi:hypothetical protein J6W34_04575 [bacterium]|nr:hypothetical protein [bacterium]